MPTLEDIIAPSAVILDVDGVKIGVTGLSIDFKKFLLD